jgi:NAD(P)-dependent dehydrogenase (short-subunit alcohol dehydrogenase family)
MNERKTAIVTGASSGIGREVAVQLAAAGYALLIVGRDRVRLEETAGQAAARAEAAGATPCCRCIPAAADLANAAAARAVVDVALKELGRVDAIANVAGHGSVTPIDKITPELWQRTIDVNVSSVVNLTAAAWPALRRQRSGVIVNVSSMSSVDPFPHLAAYATAKAAVNMFTLCTAREGREIGIRAVAVAPGAVETAMLRAFFDEAAIPRGSTLDPAFVAGVICGCVTGQRAFESGSTLVVPSPGSVFTLR